MAEFNSVVRNMFYKHYDEHIHYSLYKIDDLYFNKSFSTSVYNV